MDSNSPDSNVSTDEVQDAPNGKKSGARNKYLYATIGFLAIFLAIPYWYTSNPVSCIRCHQMEPYYSSWQESPHAVATKNCFTCHVRPGAINLWVYRISFYREIYASMVDAKLKPAGASQPGTKSCQKSGCHSLNRISSASGDIRISHRGHTTKAHLTCARCHPGAAHPGVGKVGALIPARKMCKQCHQAVMDNCGFCHIKTDQLLQGYKH